MKNAARHLRKRRDHKVTDIVRRASLLALELTIASLSQVGSKVKICYRERSRTTRGKRSSSEHTGISSIYPNEEGGHNVRTP